MNIKMLETRRISEDGHTTRRLEKDRVYDLSDSAARLVIRNGWGVETVEPVTPDMQFPMGGDIVHAEANFDRIFRPQPTRGTAPTNPATLGEKAGE